MEGRTFDIPMLTVTLHPEEITREIPRHQAKNVMRLLEILCIRRNTAIVVRDGELLTPDRALYAGDQVLVRKVTSAG